MKIVEYVTQNWQDIVTATGGIVIAARVIVKLTPTPHDDTFFAKAVSLLKHIGLNVK